MIDFLLFLSGSILFVLLFRRLFARQVSAGRIYALWLIPVIFCGLFLLQCVPVLPNPMLPHLRFSETKQPYLVWETETTLLWKVAPNAYEKLENNLNQVLHFGDDFVTETAADAGCGIVNGISVWETLCFLWGAGALLAAVVLFVPYLRICIHLKKHRHLYPEKMFGQKVYLVKKLPSSCLLGGRIYVDDKQQENAVRFANIIRHEMTHKKQGDAVWNIVRAFSVVIFWFHPLVWVAAFASKTDSEYACDEKTVRYMTEEERRFYGKSLLELAVKKDYSVKESLFACGMSDGRLTERIERVMAKNERKKQKTALFFTSVFCLSAVLLLGLGRSVIRLEKVSAFSEIYYFSRLPVSDGIYPEYCVYEDGRLYTKIYCKTEEMSEVVCQWLEYKENEKYKVVMKNNLQTAEASVCVGGTDVRHGWLREDFRRNYPALEKGEYRMNYVFCSQETGKRELFQVSFLVTKNGYFEKEWFPYTEILCLTPDF